MDPAAWRRACVEFRAKLSRNTGTDLTAVVCERLLSFTFDGEGGGEEITLQANPGRFYTKLGWVITEQGLARVLPDHLKIAWFCYREAAEVHNNLQGMNMLAGCLLNGRGVLEDPPQAAVWYQKAADLGHAASKAALGTFFRHGYPSAGIAMDVARGLALFREAVDLGLGLALYSVAQCYLLGEGVEKDAAHGVSLLRQVINQEDAKQTEAEMTLAMCYMDGNGVEADTVQAALWCQRAADGGDAGAIELLPIIRTCTFCGTRPARKHCESCRKVRYCDTTCQAVHWKRETDPHKGRCRRAAEASLGGEDGGASTSAQ